MPLPDNTIKLIKINEVHMRVECDTGIAYELADHFSFFAKGYKYHPLYKKKVWDGRIKLFNVMNRNIYVGLYDRILKFAHSRKYNVITEGEFADTPFTIEQAVEFVNSLNLPDWMEKRDYQYMCVAHAIRKRRALMLSATSSGKSFMMYCITRFLNKKTLIIVPTTSLVSQMAGDFKDYGYDKPIHQIMSGKEKKSDAMITVSTWQSIAKLPKKWFAEYEVVFGDEAHGFNAKSLTSIMEKLDHCVYRYGFTGTLDGALVNQMTLEGLFGATKVIVTAAQLIENKQASDLEIKVLMLKYDQESIDFLKGKEYQEEVDFIVGCQKRNKFIKNLVLDLKGNSLLLFQLVEKHGKVLYDMFKKAAPDRKIFFIYGGIDADIREQVRRIVEKEDNAIIIASMGTFSTGVNIKKLHNIVLAFAGKGRIKLLQSIGRGLRQHESKDKMTLYDIADDLSWQGKKIWHPNYVLKHFFERLKSYKSEKFKYKQYNIDI
jgi:superfamily II DNA or RNA helicase